MCGLDPATVTAMKSAINNAFYMAIDECNTKKHVPIANS
jgi:hypothetical protein